MFATRPLLVVTLLTASHAIASDAVCNFAPPIDSEEEAWCVAADFLAYQSCASQYGFEREAVEGNDRWELWTRDLSPIHLPSCRTIHLAVCKEDGELLYSPGSEECDAASSEE